MLFLFWQRGLRQAGSGRFGPGCSPKTKVVVFLACLIFNLSTFAEKNKYEWL
jgi:hypothetical protein